MSGSNYKVTLHTCTACVVYLKTVRERKIFNLKKNVGSLAVDSGGIYTK